jgi:hypothetical protein
MKKAATERVYHLKTGPGQHPADVVAELANLAWGVLSQERLGRVTDPHRWRGLYLAYQNVFKNRLMRFQGCGDRQECRTSLVNTDGRPLSTEDYGGGTMVYTLATGRTPEELSRLLAGLARRRFAANPASGGIKPLTDRIAAPLKALLDARIFSGDHCATCDVMKGVRERRVWAEGDQGWELAARWRRPA